MRGAEQPDQGMGKGPRTPTRDAEKEPSRGGACIAATASREARIRNAKEVEATVEIRRDWKGNGRTKRLSNDGERHVAWERMCRTQLKTMAWIGLCIWVKLGVAMTAKVTKSKPEISTAPLDIPPRVLMGPGPSSAYPRILSSSSLPLLGHMHPEFLTIMDDVKTWLKYSFQTDNKVTLAVSGSGHAAMEAAVANTIEPGDIVIVGVNGIWGQRLVDMCERYGAVVRPIHAKFGRVFSNQDVEAALQANPGTTAVILVHGESSTGTLQPLEGIGQIVRRHGALFILDAVCTLACVPLNVDEQMVDVVYSGSQKCLGAMPGASPLTMGARATAKLRSRKTKVRSYYLDMNLVGNYWGVDEDQPRAYHHTGLITNVYALREALAIVAEEGLEQAWDRHQSQAKALWDGLQKMGLELFVPDAESRLPTVTTVKVPAGVDWKAVSTYVMEKYSLEISGGLGPTAGQVWRIGIMGHNARPGNVAMMLSALEDALKHVKWTGLKPVGKTVVEKTEL